MIENKILIAGLVRDCERSLRHNVGVLKNAFSRAKELHFLMVESDSLDNSIGTLQNLTLEYENFHYVSLGHLCNQYPRRTERLAYCRNVYLKLISEPLRYYDIDYVVIADMDGVNDKLTFSALATCWSRLDWDVCTANQAGPYYDIWALRHYLWSPNDCWRQVDFLKNLGVSQFRCDVSSVYSRMIKIPPQSEWIEVESAFGGLAIYRKEILLSSRYVGLTINGEEVCEHVSLHQQIRAKGGRIFINPAMINTGKTEHARYATSVGLVKFWMRCQLREMANRMKLLPHLRKARALIGRLSS